MFCSDAMSGSHFIGQTSTFLLINATAVTLGEGHGKVIEYISPDPYIICAQYLRFSSNGFNVRGKSCCGGNALKTWSHPRLGWLNDHKNKWNCISLSRNSFSLDLIHHTLNKHAYKRKYPPTSNTDTFLLMSGIPCFQFTCLAAIMDFFTSCTWWETYTNGAPTLIAVAEHWFPENEKEGV